MRRRYRSVTLIFTSSAASALAAGSALGLAVKGMGRGWLGGRWARVVRVRFGVGLGVVVLSLFTLASVSVILAGMRYRLFSFRSYMLLLVLAFAHSHFRSYLSCCVLTDRILLLLILCLLRFRDDPRARLHLAVLCCGPPAPRGLTRRGLTFMNPAHQVCATLLSEAEVCCSTLHPKRNSRLFCQDPSHFPKTQPVLLWRPKR